MNINTDSPFIPGKSQWVMQVLIFLWSLAQPLAVTGSIPMEIRFDLFFWKNILGVITVAFGLLIIFINLTQKHYPKINRTLFLLSLVFPFYSLFNMLFRGGSTSIEEQILYFLWPLALFIIFPAFFYTLDEQRKAISVILLANLIALMYAIFSHIRQENLTDWLNYRYRLSFGIIQPNIYSASWVVVFACSVFLILNSHNLVKKRLLFFTSILSLVFIFLARSETLLLLCLTSLVAYILFEAKFHSQVKIGITFILLAILLIPLSNIILNSERLYQVTSGRVAIWSRLLDINLANADIFDYLIGRTNVVAGNIHFTGNRQGLQTNRTQSDNVYLALFIQRGVIGLLLYFFPFFVMLFFLFRQRANAAELHNRKLYSWVLSIWLGVFISLIGLDLIPSFGNVINIFLFVVSASVLAPTSSAPNKQEGAGLPLSISN